MLVIHIPHASACIPPDLREQFVVDDRALNEELRLMTDHFTDLLFSHDTAQVVMSSVSRLVVDVERFEQDEQEVMASRGMGALYERRHNGERLRRVLGPAERVRLIDRYYRPHHQQLGAAVSAALRPPHPHPLPRKRGRGDRCLLVDGHSFASTPLPYELDQRPDRPDLCLGTDDFHTPQWLCDAARRAFEREGLTVDVNRPFSGALVPGPFYQKDKRVIALMIEVNRRLYLDEATAAPLPCFGAVKAVVDAATSELAAATDAHAVTLLRSSRRRAQALRHVD